MSHQRKGRLKTGDTRDALNHLWTLRFFIFFSSRNYYFLGGDFYSTYQQCFEPDYLYFDHQTVQGNDPSTLVQLQAKKVCRQKRDSEGICSVIHLGGNVALARDAHWVHEASSFHRPLWSVSSFSVISTQLLFLAGSVWKPFILREYCEVLLEGFADMK